MKKIKTLLWYLRRPSVYPQLLQVMKLFFTRRLHEKPVDSDVVKKWCCERAVDSLAAIRALTDGRELIDPSEEFPDQFSNAQRKAESCPFSMGGGANLPLIYTLCRNLKVEHVLETGVAFGWSSLAFLLALKDRDDALLYSTDMPYPKRNNDGWVGCVVPEDMSNIWTLLRGADRWGIPKALRVLNPLDLCHYDSDKRYDGRLWAYGRIWNALRPGGLLVSDDISDNFAFRDFAKQVGVDPVIISFEGKHQGVLKKPMS